MINIKVTSVPYIKEKIARVQIEGHANYAEHGKDIVCSSVSVIVQHTIQACELIKVAMNVTMEEGKVDVFISNLVDREGQLLWQSAVNTFRQIAEQYPDYVKLEEVE